MRGASRPDILLPMFIRRAKTRTTENGETYYAYRLVESQRSADKVRQRTLLNLGSNFPVGAPALAALVRPYSPVA